MKWLRALHVVSLRIHLKTSFSVEYIEKIARLFLYLITPKIKAEILKCSTLENELKNES